MPGRAFLILVFILFAGCSRKVSEIPLPPAPSRADVWTAIQPRAERYRIEPGFIYALVAAESDFNPLARNGGARGLLQLKPEAWREVSDAAYEPTVWNWRLNLEVGIDYLAQLRSKLHRAGHFSYPLWAASFHYGFDRVQDENYEIARLPPPAHPVLQALWHDQHTPIPPP